MSGFQMVGLSDFISHSKSGQCPNQPLVAGREHLVQLETPGAADQKYNLAFQVVDNLPPSDPVQVTSNFSIVVNLNNSTCCDNINTAIKNSSPQRKLQEKK